MLLCLAIVFSNMTTLLAGIAQAQKTIHVPGDASSIQGGIVLATNGDTVLVGPGTYPERIDFIGKNITVASSAGPQTTIIDAQGTGVVVTFENGETRQAVLNGFTVRGAALGGGTASLSDGILVQNADPTIINNVITKNQGYGIQVSGGSAYISGNAVSYTSTAYDPRFDFGCDYDDGTGILIQGTSNSITDPVIIDHNTIENNVGHCWGAGIALYAAPGSTVISNNVIAHNQGLGEGGAIWLVNGDRVSIFQNLIYDNVSGTAGGGIYLGLVSEVGGATGPLNLLITNNTIYGNTIQLNTLIQDAWVDGSQIAFSGYVSQVGMFNNIIIGADKYGAIACWSVYQYLSGAPPVVVNSDVMNTAGPAYSGWCTSPAGAVGNISADPKFVNAANGDFHLAPGSPAIDSGFNAAPGLQPKDLDGNPRIRNATGTAIPIVDMGVYEAAGAGDSRSPSQTTLTAGASSVYYGQSVTLSADVTDSSSAPIESGTVSLLDDWAVLQKANLNTSGTAAFSTSGLSVGPHWMVAAFGGTTQYSDSVSSAVGITITGFSTSTSIAFSSNPVPFGQSVTVTSKVTTAPANPSGTGVPTGKINFVVSGSRGQSVTVPLDANGVATWTTSSLPVGYFYIQAIYVPTGGFLQSASTNVPLQVQSTGASISVTPAASRITSAQSLDVTIKVNATSGSPIPTGTVTLSSGSYTSSATSLSQGSATITIPAGSLALGTDTLTAAYSGDGNYAAATGTASVTVTAVGAGFNIGGQTVVVKAGATSGNTSTITVTPVGGFTGPVALSAAISSSPAGASSLPTLSFASSSVTISGAGAATALLTVTTSAPGGCQQTAAAIRGLPIYAAGDVTLIGFVFLGVPRRRRGRTAAWLILLLLAISGSVTACGGGGGGATCNAVTAGTTPGSYVIKVTGASGTITAETSIDLSVQ